MTRRAAYILIILFLLVAAGCATTGTGSMGGTSQNVNTIVGVDVKDYSVQFKTSDVFSSSFTVYKPSDPYTVVVELPDMALSDDIPEKMTPGKKGISEIKFIKSETPTRFLRVEILLDTPTEVTPKKEKHELLLNIEPPTEEMAAAAGGPAALTNAEAETGGLTNATAETGGLSNAAAGTGALTNAAAAGEEGAGEWGPAGEKVVTKELTPATKIIDAKFDFSDNMVKFVLTGNGAMTAKVFTLPKRIVIDVPGVTMATKTPSTVLDPVKGIRVGKYDSKTRVVLDVAEDVEFIASAHEDRVTVTMPLKEAPVVVSPEKAAEAAAPTEAAAPAKGAAPEAVEGAAGAAPAPPAPAEKKKYTGKLVSLDFQDADIVPIFRFLGDVAGYNVVIHPSVSGRITLKLKNVPWDQALDIILEMSNLGKSVEGNILRIAPNSVFTSLKEEEARLSAAQQKVATLVQEAIKLRYISAADMLKRLQEAKAMSPRGTARIDERTNNLIINDTEDTIRKIRDEEVPYWDTPDHGTLQVLIEAKIVEVSTDTTQSLGIRWGGNATNNNFSFINDASTYDFSVNTPVAAAGPSATAQGGILAIGYTQTFTVNMSLEALESVNKVRKLANPRLITIDKTAATIKQGVQIPFSTVSSEGTKTEFQEATLELDVTPEIQPNGILKLKVDAKNDTPVAINDQTGINKQEITTQALVKDGQTLVLGGIYTNTEQESETRVPLLGRIPLLGWLFKTRQKTTQPFELLIFITPKVVK